MNIHAKTILCGIIGNPVDHSKSPRIHNAAFQALGMSGVYLYFNVSDIRGATVGIRALNIRGASVTVPYKITVMKYLDRIDELARQIGAVNTIVNDNGILKGYNTDCMGSIKALEEHVSLTGKRVTLIGAGGAARAIAFGLEKKRAHVLILNRTANKAKALAHATHADSGSFKRMSEIRESDILIHATRVGLSDTKVRGIVPFSVLHKNLTVFDIVYGSGDTALVKDALRVGCDVIRGESMLLHQATQQFELFTGKKAPFEVMKKALVKGGKTHAR